MGILSAQQAKGRKSLSFEYGESWLEGSNLFLLDPEIVLFSGPQFPGAKENFGVFLDSMPDSWGRTLMKRRAAQIAKEDGRPVPVLHDIDFLLGVADTCRMGGLRFKIDRDGPFLDDDRHTPVPPWTSVGELQHIAGLVESDKDTRELNKWLVMLMAPGSSLGGARPKANIIDKNGQLWIAKFPSKNDTIDKAKWEYLVYRLALIAGINMSESRIEKVAGNHFTFFTKRFDRVKGERIHFASAMTMTGNNEEMLRDKRASYLDLSLFIQDHGGNIKEDLTELWRRIVFNIAISNTDDHLRNHGFIIENGQWRLSPAFDVNPSTDKEELALNIDDTSGLLDFELALSVSEFFRLSNEEAVSILSRVRKAIGNWEKLAKQLGIPRVQIDMMRSAFRF
ncbi:MAG: HipA domain-containing protein [Bacteroidales bacterium]|jgi:serine/threonine-protein kinase HipA|nr:HipA domain-containing protein [Bacteroidales bacterium]